MVEENRLARTSERQYTEASIPCCPITRQERGDVTEGAWLGGELRGAMRERAHDSAAGAAALVEECPHRRKRPMGRLQNESSQSVYATYWVRLICYCLRVLQSDDAQQTDSAGGDRFSDGESLDIGQQNDLEGDPDIVPAEATVPDGERNNMYDARRLFPWREGQKALAQQLLQAVETDASMDGQISALLRFSETLIFQKVYGDVFQSPLLHFLAVLGIDEDNNRLRQGNDFSYMLAGVVYCVRVIALEILLPAEQRSSQGETEFEMFLDRRKEYLADGTLSPMSTAISLLAYGKYLALNHGNVGSIFWEKGDRVMRLHSSRVVMDKFRAIVAAAIVDAEHLLWQELMWGANRFEMDLDELTDDFTFRKRGAYFVNNEQNGIDKVWRWMTGRMKQTKAGRKLRKNKQWHHRRAIEYLRQVDKFRKLLLFVVHTTGGQPKRGTEILALRFKNGCLQDRNVFVLDGMVMIVSRYYKSQSQ